MSDAKGFSSARSMSTPLKSRYSTELSTIVVVLSDDAAIIAMPIMPTMGNTNPAIRIPMKHAAMVFKKSFIL